MANLTPPRNPKLDAEVNYTEYFDFTDWLGLQIGNILFSVRNSNLFQGELPAMFSDRICNQGKKMLITDPALPRHK